MESGYDASSMDEIARVSGVSKPTLYKYFPDKQSLYAAIVTRECTSYADRLFTVDLERADLRDALDKVALHYVDLLTSPMALDVFRVVVGDSQRFPALSRAFHEAGPAQGVLRLSHLIAAGVARRELSVGDVGLAAAQFIELCKADLFYKLVFGVRDSATAADKARIAAAAVTTFLNAHRVPPAG